jgi:predicted glycoside hydrolase/deacetylase ChbG (UPF0249 family)
VLGIGRAFPQAARWLGDVAELGVGVHLAAVGEEPPLLSAREIPTLLDRRGSFPRSWRGFVRQAAAGRVDPDDLRREFAAQVERVRQVGVPLTHLDAHQHLHLWPAVGEVVVGLARRFGIGAVRVPRLRAPTVTGLGVTILARRLAGRARRAGLGFPGDAVGIEVAGSLDTARMERVLRRLGAGTAGTVELTVHPGEAHDPDRQCYRWGYRWGDELEALTSSSVRRAVADCGFTLATYRALPVTVPSPGGVALSQVDLRDSPKRR